MSTTVTRNNGIYFLELHGAPFEIGRLHGMALRHQIFDQIATMKAQLDGVFGAQNAARIISWVVNETTFVRDYKRYLPEVYDEMAGLAEGAEVPFSDILLINMFEEVWEAAPLQLGLPMFGGVNHTCTSCNITGNPGRPILNGQNMDYTPNLDGSQLVMQRTFAAGGKELIYGFVGQVTGPGMNNRGVSCTINTLPQGRKREDNGLGSAFIVRAILETGSVDEALVRLRELPRFSGGIHSIADNGKTIIVEATPSEVAQVEPVDARFNVHANHALAIQDRIQIPGWFDEHGEPVVGPAGSRWMTKERQAAAEAFLSAHDGMVSVDDLKQMFTTAPINSTDPGFMTLQSVIFVHDPDDLVMYASAGCDPKRGWNEYHF
jgi:hypothetical protein